MIHALTIAAGTTAADVVGTSLWPVLVEAVDGHYPGSFNDTHTHTEVLAALDRAIAIAEAKSRELVYA